MSELLGTRDIGQLTRLARDPRWVIRPEARTVIPDKLLRVIAGTNPDGKPYSTRAQLMAVRLLALLDAQNMKQEERDDPTDLRVVHTGVIGHEHDVRVRVIEDDNWYGTADRLAAEAADVADSDSAALGQVQADRGGPASGEVGNGFAGGP